MNLKRHIKDLLTCLENEKGITLAELLISIAILGVVIGSAQLLNHFGLISFNKGNIQTNLQQQLRIVDTFITKEVRHATEIDILEEVPNSIDDKYNYIFMDDDGNIVSIKGTTRKIVAEEISSLEFTSYDTTDFEEILSFKVNNLKKDQHYEVEKVVQPVNMALLNANIGNSDKLGIGIRYRSILPLTIDPSRLKPGIINEFYSHQFTAFGGTPPYTFSINEISGTGLNFSSSTGLFSGIPIKAGEYNLQITVTDSVLDEDSYETKLIINDSGNSIPSTPPDVLDANSIGWFNGNSGNINANNVKSTKGVKFKAIKKYDMVLRSQVADFTSPELYFENNLLIQSGANMVLNSNQVVFRGIVELEKKNKQPSGKLCLKGYMTNEDIKVYFVGGVYEGNEEIVKPGTVITIKNGCYGGN